jgi:hypothetical protein
MIYRAAWIIRNCTVESFRLVDAGLHAGLGANRNRATFLAAHRGSYIKKKFPAFYRTRRIITVFTRALHWSLF